MPRTIPAVMAALLALSASPTMAADTEAPATDAVAADETAVPEGAGQRLEAPDVGLSITFPDGWRVSRPAGTRESEIRSADGEPVYVTTAVLANGGDGRWCDIDVYLDMIAPLDEHAHAYAAYLQRVHGANLPMRLTEMELPAGPAFGIEMLDLERARVRATYLFDGPVAEDGTIDRFVLTCAAAPDTEPFWGAIAESAEVYASAAVEPEA